jgi:hypothetical protein
MQFKSQSKFFWYAIIILVCFLFYRCKPSQDQQSAENVTLAAYETEEFLTFYDRFAEDSLFQLEHTVFPLEGVKAVLDSSQVINPNFKWQKENWVIHKPFDDMGGSFSREFMDVNGIVIEFISDESGQFTMERRFGKLSSGWHMIYYREMGRY